MANQDLNGQKTVGNEQGWPRDSWEVLEVLVDRISCAFALIVVFVVNVAFNALWIVLLFWSFGLLPSGIRSWLLGLAGLG
jgi:hypothetical protein